MKTLLLFLFSFSLLGQTKADLQSQVRISVANASMIFALPSGGGFTPVQIDAATLELVVGPGGVMFLRAKPPAPTPIVFQEDFFKTTAAQTAFITTKVVSGGKGNIMVFRNGLLQREVEDYAAQENVGIWTITFKNQIPTNDFITIRYPTS